MFDAFDSRPPDPVFGSRDRVLPERVSSPGAALDERRCEGAGNIDPRAALREGLSELDEIESALEIARDAMDLHSDTRRECDLHELLRAAIEDARSQEPLACTIETLFERGAVRLEAYSGELRGAFVELIVNALQAVRGRHGDAFADAGRVQVSTLRAGEWARVTVLDNGCGIDALEIDEVFEPYFSTKCDDGTRGLGLAAVHSIVVRRHGGSVRVQSQRGAWTSFTVEVPVRGDRTSAARDRLQAALDALRAM